MTKKNIILIDAPSSNEDLEFVHGIEEKTNTKWEVKYYVSNDRSSKIKEVFRYCKYFYYPLLIFIYKNKYDKIVAWQQFYGLLLAFYCKLFRVKKTFSLIVMTFIYKRKSGWLGKIYYLFIKFVLNSNYIDKIIVFSQNEVNYYFGLFPCIDKFVYVPLGIEKMTNLQIDNKLRQQKYILSVGRSNRDYRFLYETLKDTEFQVKILSNSVNLLPTDNIKIHTNVFGQEMYHLLNNCFCVVIPLADPEISSGQLVLLQAMQLGKPCIVTESKGISDYITNDYNGIIIKKEKEALIKALQKLFSNDNLYIIMSQNAILEYEKKYSLKILGNNIGNIIKSIP